MPWGLGLLQGSTSQRVKSRRHMAWALELGRFQTAKIRAAIRMGQGRKEIKIERGGVIGRGGRRRGGRLES